MNLSCSFQANVRVMINLTRTSNKHYSFIIIQKKKYTQINILHVHTLAL